MANFLACTVSTGNTGFLALISLAERIFSPVKMADRLGEQLLTDVKAFLNVTLRFAKAFKFGVLQTVLL